MATRTDVHRPSAIDPQDYDYVGCEWIPGAGSGDLGALAALQGERDAIRAHMLRTGGRYSRHAHGGNCHVCGNANAIYTSLFHHRPTNTYVRVGSECANKLDIGDGEAFRSLARIKDEVARARVALAGKNKARQLLADAGLAKAFDIYCADATGKQREELTITDIVSNCVRYGSLSPKQLAYLRTLVSHIDNRAEIEAQRAAEYAAAADVPETEERIAVRGKLLTIKRNEYTGAVRMLVQHEDGFKLWGSLPVAFSKAERGCEVEFCAQVKRSDNDPKFGFFRRPTKCRIISRAA